MATYSFLFAGIIGRQRIVEATSTEGILTDIYIGLSMILEFFFYMGLLKVRTYTNFIFQMFTMLNLYYIHAQVAEHMINPYGERDEHFDVDFLLKRHAQVGTNHVSTIMLGYRLNC